jgi:hypothetical protein
VDPNADVVQSKVFFFVNESKVFLDPLLRGLLEERKIDLIIFQVAPPKRFLGAIFRGALGDAQDTRYLIPNVQ